MTLSPDKAAEALKDIGRTERRSFTAYGYQSAAPYLILWGLIWGVGYSANDLFPAYSAQAWWVLLTIGFVVSAVIGRRAGRGKLSSRANNIVGLRITACWVVLLGFFYALFTVMAPVTDRQVSVFFPLFFGTIYMLVGIWIGVRIAIAGAVVIALALIAFFYVHVHFGLWMAALSGGTLLLSGLWLRRA